MSFWCSFYSGEFHILVIFPFSSFLFWDVAANRLLMQGSILLMIIMTIIIIIKHLRSSCIRWLPSGTSAADRGHIDFVEWLQKRGNTSEHSDKKIRTANRHRVPTDRSGTPGGTTRTILFFNILLLINIITINIIINIIIIVSQSKSRKHCQVDLFSSSRKTNIISIHFLERIFCEKIFQLKTSVGVLLEFEFSKGVASMHRPEEPLRRNLHLALKVHSTNIQFRAD